MTAIITKLKSSKLTHKFASISWWISLIAAASSPAIAIDMPKLPVLQNVGVVPLVIEEPEGHDPKLEQPLEQIGTQFPKVVRDSHRFRVINDEVVSDLWKDAKGRKELQEEYEISALIGATAVPQSDVVTVVARIMDPELKIFIQEQDRIPTDWLLAASSAKIKDRLEQLVFSLFNRIPVDVSVTSVVGSFITISGGSEQGVLPGDRLDLQRIRVKALHPANGSWLGFDAKKLGTAEVVDVKTHNSVARLIGQSHDRAIEIGDGAKIPAIRSRNRFARLAQEDGFKDSRDPKTVIMPPVYLGESATSTALASKPGAKQPEPTRDTSPRISNDITGPETRENRVDATAPETTPLTAESDTQAPTPRPTEADDPGDEISFIDRLKSPQNKWLDDIHAYFGPHWWSVRGPVNASGKFPLWLLNSAGVGVTRTLVYKIKTGFGGGALFGQTSKGNFIGYDGNAKLYWEDVIPSESGFVSWWHLGGYASLSGLSVSREKFGGGDWLRGGVFAGLGGSLTATVMESNKYDWFADFAILPLNLGRFGYGGKQQLVESAFGTRFTLGAYIREEAEPIQWGGAVDISDERLTLKNSRRPHMSDYRLKLLAKYSF